ncbi:MAG TPA: caspase family protein [Candidatus Aquabacterium excrementipullorum]|nr:caspase family protein [Candidatus Aquabacterium excrementipullorum]
MTQAPPDSRPSPTRRQFLGGSLAFSLPLAGWLSGAWAQGYGTAPAGGGDKSSGPAPVRLALLIGNRAYPPPFDLPPVHKNVRDLQAVLEKRGFKVTAVVDQDPGNLRRAIAQFAQQCQSAPPDASVMFYYTGHGMQVDTENLLLGSGVNPSAAEAALLGGSLHFKRDVIDALPKRPAGLTMAVIDACRTNLRAALQAGDGFNQVEAPVGCLIAFSTGAGKPAISPSVETANTFYTASLVKVLSTASDDITFSDMFRLVKTDVQNTMLNHPVAGIRAMAQFPFIAENVRVKMRLSLFASTQGAPVKFNSQDESSLWQELEGTAWPADILRLSDDYLKRFPTSTLAGSAQVARDGADDAAKAMRRNDVRLFKSAFFPKVEAGNPVWADIRKAARGDKDAAARVARIYLQGDGVGKDVNRYEGWMQYAAALGNGIASYELAVYYRNVDQPVMAAQYETRARELAYTPPPTLDHNRK